MGEAKVGEAFITHEFDESIAIHRAIVEAEEQLSKSHPAPDAKPPARPSSIRLSSSLLPGWPSPRWRPHRRR